MPDEAVNHHVQRAECDTEAKAARSLSPAALEQRRWAAVDKAIYASKSAARLRRDRLRPLVSRLKREFPHLRDKPSRQVYDLAEAYEVKSLIFLDIAENGVAGADGDSRRMVADHFKYLEQCRSLETRLDIPITPADDVLSILNGGAR